MKTATISKSLLTLGLLATLTSTASAFGPGGHRGHGPRDTDGDGVISQEEFLAGVQQKFERGDSDGDGVITLAEMQARAQEHFQEMDSDGDGSLSRNEMRNRRRGPPPSESGE